MNRTSPSTIGPHDATGLFPNDAEWVRTQVLDARAIGTCEFDLDAFERYRRIRILTYSSSVRMLSTVLDRFEEASVECVLGYSRAVNDIAAIVALQTAAMEDVQSALRGLSAQRREEILERVREGRLQVRVVEGHVSHAKVFLLSDGPEGDRCVLTSTSDGTRPSSNEGRASKNKPSKSDDWRTSATQPNINQREPEPPLRDQPYWPI